MYWSITLVVIAFLFAIVVLSVVASRFGTKPAMIAAIAAATVAIIGAVAAAYK